jgi:phosphoglycolate phosphatase
MKQRIELVIFDLDGTLVDAYPAITSSFNYTLQKLGYSRQDPLVIRRAVGWGDRELLKPFLSEADLDKGLKIYRCHHQKALLKGAGLLPGAKGILNYLKAEGYKLAVATNRPTRFSRILLHHLKLESYFDFLLCGDKLKKAKPHPEILQKILRKFSLMPSQAVYVGDMTIDAQAGRRAGIKTILVTTGSHTRGQIKAEKPYKIVHRMAGLRKLL